MNEAAALTPTQSASPMNVIMGIDTQVAVKEMNAITKFQALVNSQLVKDQDYGVIPGTQKPTLLKPGAEKILMLLGLKSEYRVTDKVEDFEDGFFAYTVEASLYHNGALITQGLGAANTKESRYRQNEWVQDSSGRRTKTWDGTTYQDPYTLQNTVLKMAKKRAQVDATLTVGSLSNVFTQDMEDMKDFAKNEVTQTMQTGDAADVLVTFGKHKDQTVGEIVQKDRGYATWLADNAKDPALKQAAAMVLKNGTGNQQTPKQQAPQQQAPQQQNTTPQQSQQQTPPTQNNQQTSNQAPEDDFMNGLEDSMPPQYGSSNDQRYPF